MKTHFGNQSCAMFWQQTVRHIAMLITNGSNDVFCLFGHLIKEQIDNTKTSFSDVCSFFRAKFVGDLRKMTTDEWEGNDISIKKRKKKVFLIQKLSKRLFFSFFTLILGTIHK